MRLRKSSRARRFARRVSGSRAPSSLASRSWLVRSATLAPSTSSRSRCWCYRSPTSADRLDAAATTSSHSSSGDRRSSANLRCSIWDFKRSSAVAEASSHGGGRDPVGEALQPGRLPLRARGSGPVPRRSASDRRLSHRIGCPSSAAIQPSLPVGGERREEIVDGEDEAGQDVAQVEQVRAALIARLPGRAEEAHDAAARIGEEGQPHPV